MRNRRGKRVVVEGRPYASCAATAGGADVGSETHSGVCMRKCTAAVDSEQQQQSRTEQRQQRGSAAVQVGGQAV